MSQSANNNSSSAIENLVGFITFSAVSVGSVYLMAGAFTSVVNHLMRYGVIEISRAFGGVI